MTTTVSAWAGLCRDVQADVLAGLGDHVDRLSWSRDQIRTLQRQGLARLLAQAAEHSPFHARRLRGVDPSAVDPDDLSALPVMTKADMMKDLDDVFTDRRLRRADVLVGKTPADDDAFAFNTDMCIVELVDRENRPTPVGTPAAKVLITNLCNLAQPLIRYELTDRFVRIADAPGHGHLRARVQGRNDETFHYRDGTAVHPIAVRSVILATLAIVD